MAKETGPQSGKTPSGSALAALPAVRVASSLFRPHSRKSPLAPKAPMASKVPQAGSNASAAPVARRVSAPSIPPPPVGPSASIPPVSVGPRSSSPPPSYRPPPPLPPGIAPMASDAIHTIPPPPPSAPRSSRDPQNPLAVMSLASIRVQAAPPSAAPYAPPKPMYQAPLSTTARMQAPSTPAAFSTTPSDAPVVIPSVPPPAPPSAPPSSPSSVRYERAFRTWSYSTPPPSDMEDAEASQGPLTYQVYTAQDISVAPRASRMNFANAMPAPVPLHKRVGMMVTGAAIVLCTAAAVMLGVVDDGPKAPREAAGASLAAPPAAVDPTPIDPNASSLTTTTSFIPPMVTIVDDPNAQPVAPTPKPRKKKTATTDGSGSIINVSANAAAPTPPPNPYAVSKK